MEGKRIEEKGIKEKRIDGYLVLKELGEGSMGQVFLGIKEGRNIPVAIKTARAEKVALWREYEILKSLKDSRFPSVYEYKSIEEFDYFVMEYISGTDLEHVIQSGGLKKEEVLPLMKSIVDVIWSLHSGRPPVYYLDLKPSNIIIEPSGAIRLIDFGTAIRQGEGKGLLGGTLGYASPELRRGALGDAKADVYALGALFSYLLTGINPALPPFQIETKNLPKEYQSVIKRATAEQAEERYQNAGDLLNDLKRLSEYQEGKNYPWISDVRGMFRKKPFIKKREWNVLLSEKKVLGLW